MRNLWWAILLCLGIFIHAPLLAADKTAERENAEGLSALRNGKRKDAVTHFDKAYTIDPSYHIALFNSACASAKLGDVEIAKQKLDRYLVAAPDKVSKVLYDPDLEAVREDTVWLGALRSRIRSETVKVRPIVLERRESGADLYIASEDGLDLFPLATDPNLREHTATFSGSGEAVVFLAGKKNYDNSVIYDFKQGGGQILHEPDDSLRAVSLVTGKQIVLANRVHHYQITDDGKSVLFVDRAAERRKPGGKLRVRKVSIYGGEASTLAEIDGTAAVFCLVEKDNGLIVVEGHPHQGWLTGLRLRVVEYRGNTGTVLFQQPRSRPADPKIFDFPACMLSPEKTAVDLGNAVVKLSPAGELVYRDGVAFGHGAYIERRKGDRAGTVTGTGTGGSTGAVTGAAPGFFLTVDGNSISDDEYEGTIFPDLWKLSSLSAVLSNGMGPDTMYRTEIRRVFMDGRGLQTLTKKGIFTEYGPAVSAQNDRLAFTRLTAKNGNPWIFTAKMDGSEARPVVPGQYPMWGPLPMDFKTLANVKFTPTGPLQK